MDVLKSKKRNQIKNISDKGDQKWGKHPLPGTRKEDLTQPCDDDSSSPTTCHLAIWCTSFKVHRNLSIDPWPPALFCPYCSHGMLTCCLLVFWIYIPSTYHVFLHFNSSMHFTSVAGQSLQLSSNTGNNNSCCCLLRFFSSAWLDSLTSQKKK